MTPQELSTERIIFAALLKAASEQACYLTGTMQFQMKAEFNMLVKRMDEFVNDVTKKMQGQPGGVEYFEGITDCYHNFNIEMRRGMNEKYKELTEKEG
jgi:hypothetical protein